jgi:hypothetical protein
MNKKTFYIVLAAWCVALAALVGVLVNHFVGKDDDSTIKPPAQQEQTGGGDKTPSNPDADDEKNWTGNY